MLKRLCSILFFMIFLLVSVDGSKGFIGISGNLFISADKEFKSVYKSAVFTPRISAGFYLFDNAFIWSDFEFLSIEGTTVGELLMKTKSNRSFISFGFGYDFSLSNKLNLLLKAGASNINYKEEAFNEELSGSTFGINLSSSFLLKIKKQFGFIFSFSYVIGNDTIIYGDESIKFKFSGLSTGLGIILKF